MSHESVLCKTFLVCHLTLYYLTKTQQSCSKSSLHAGHEVGTELKPLCSFDLYKPQHQN